jgi:hypothetical protein
MRSTVENRSCRFGEYAFNSSRRCPIAARSKFFQIIDRHHAQVDLVLAESLLSSLQPEHPAASPPSIVSFRRQSSAHGARKR